MIFKWIEMIKEKKRKEDEQYVREFLDFYFNKLKSGQKFTLLHLFDPLDFYMAVTPEDAAKFIEKKHLSGEVALRYYLKCPMCNKEGATVKKEDLDSDTKSECHGCKKEFSVNKETIHVAFTKI